MAIGDRSVVSANWADCGLGRDVVEAIRNLAERHEICRIVLFGSRARGDFNKKSDIDLAVSGGNFGMFSLNVDELTPTLLRFDFVNMDEIDDGEASRGYRNRGEGSV